MTKSSPSPLPPTSSSPGESVPPVVPPFVPPFVPDGELDLAGELCPFTFVRTKLALEALPIGATLRVLVDHEPAIRNIPRSALEWGQEILAIIPLSPTTWAIDLRKRVR